MFGKYNVVNPIILNDMYYGRIPFGPYGKFNFTPYAIGGKYRNTEVPDYLNAMQLQHRFHYLELLFGQKYISFRKTAPVFPSNLVDVIKFKHDKMPFGPGALKFYDSWRMIPKELDEFIN